MPPTANAKLPFRALAGSELAVSDLLAELKRRNVFRVGFAYLVVGYVLVEVAGTLEDMLSLPSWFDAAIFAALIIGFPLTLLFSWVFELTPEGLKMEKDVDRSVSITTETGQKLNFVIIASLVAAVGFLLADRSTYSSSRGPGHR